MCVIKFCGKLSTKLYHIRNLSAPSLLMKSTLFLVNILMLNIPSTWERALHFSFQIHLGVSKPWVYPQWFPPVLGPDAETIITHAGDGLSTDEVVQLAPILGMGGTPNSWMAFLQGTVPRNKLVYNPQAAIEITINPSKSSTLLLNVGKTMS